MTGEKSTLIVPPHERMTVEVSKTTGFFKGMPWGDATLVVTNQSEKPLIVRSLTQKKRLQIIVRPMRKGD